MSLLAKILQTKTNARPVRPGRSSRDRFAVSYAGWTIAAPPPAVPGAGHFAASPSAPIRMQAADGAWLLPQTVTPARPNADQVQADAAAGNDEEFWGLVANNGSPLPVTFTLTLPDLPVRYRCDVDMTIVLAACAPGPPVLSVSVNGQTLEIHHPTDESWFSQRITIPARLLTEGANEIVLNPLGRYYGIWIEAVHFVSAGVPISVSSQWLQVCAGEVGPGDTFRRTVELRQGLTASEAQLQHFARQFGIDVASGDMDQLLAGISTHLAARLEHAVSIESETTVAHDVHVGPASESGLTFQVWQLALVYEANGCRLVQALGRNGPILVRQFPASAGG